MIEKKGLYGENIKNKTDKAFENPPKSVVMNRKIKSINNQELKLDFTNIIQKHCFNGKNSER